MTTVPINNLEEVSRPSYRDSWASYNEYAVQEGLLTKMTCSVVEQPTENEADEIQAEHVETGWAMHQMRKKKAKERRLAAIPRAKLHSRSSSALKGGASRTIDASTYFNKIKNFEREEKLFLKRY